MQNNPLSSGAGRCLLVGRVRQKGTSCIFASLPLLVEDVFLVMRPINRNDHNDYRHFPSFCLSPNENMTGDDYELGIGTVGFIIILWQNYFILQELDPN